jgi:hypothetical protein
MALPDRLHVGTQQNLITLLCFDDQHGRLVAQLIDASKFDGDYRDVATRAIDYWQTQGRAPGKGHIGDVLSDLLDDDRRMLGIRRILTGMLQLIDNINAEYVLQQLRLFNRLQGLKDAIMTAAEKLSNPQATSIEEVEALLGDILRADQIQFDRGTKLDDDLESLMAYLDSSQSEFNTGIHMLDKRGIVPARGALMLFIAGKGRGKTWFLTNVGKQSLLLHKKVLHISLEINEPEQRMRYYQSLFGAPRHNGPVDLIEFDIDDRDHMRGFFNDAFDPEFSFQSASLRDELTARIERMGSASNLIIKRFPARTLTMANLIGYMDMLEQVDRLCPLTSRRWITP